MNPDDEYQAWLNARRGESPPAEMADRIMSAVRASASQSVASPQPECARKSAWQRVVPYLVCSAAALVLAVRLYSIASLFLVASSDMDVVMTEPFEEIPHVDQL